MSRPAWFSLGVLVGTLICPGVPIAYRLINHRSVLYPEET